MNEDLLERFARSKKALKKGRDLEPDQAQVWILPQQLNLKVRKYFEDANKPVDGGRWLNRPEIPTSGEVLDIDVDGSSNSGVVEIVPNRPQGQWESKETYLGALYELLREDAVRPLREAVSQVRITPMAGEDAFNGSIGIYEKVHICAVTCSSRGIAIRVTFSLLRTGKKILWEQSKRLISGSLVVLTPASDMFKSKAIVATIAARPLAALQQNPPEVDLFIAQAEELELDPAQEFVMIEDRGGLYESDRHTLLALQRMMRESFPLSEHLVAAQTSITAPSYVQKQPHTDLTSVLTNNKHETFESVDILKSWPEQPPSGLDASQLTALRRILTKRLAIVQGPPGTGKTHVSVEAIRIMLANRTPDDPPIIVACQTNHAVDQILKKIAPYESEFIRLGGRSKDKDVIKARTLYEVRNQTSENPLSGSLAPSARKKMKEIEKEIGILLSPLRPGRPLQPLDFRALQNFGLISQQQADSLENGASKWVQDQLSNPNEARSPFSVWLGKALITVPPKQMPEDFGFDYEEADLEFEHIKESEAESMSKDDEDFESLSGISLSVADNFTCRKMPGMTEGKVKDALKEQDMWKIPEAMRPAVYRHLQVEAKKIMLTAFREKAKVFNEHAARRRIGLWEQDETILKKQKIIGMTTTGLSKYRGLLASLEPGIILIEEAAEILEAPVTVACIPSLQHLILVGDHQQLRPHTHVKAHEEKPFFLNVSLFERLVNNRVEFDTLSKQRRMIPEIRRLLHPIYGNLIRDHASVLDPEKRPNVPGMGGLNSFFFTHQWSENRDHQMSAYNPEEAEMIVGFFEYLVYNGMKTEDITILTFYNGQRKKILKQLREKINPGQSPRFYVNTVDSYQGEENKVVILSLVRSNDKGQIGFLNIENRVCVALSRAQCGFYIFGNGMMLYAHKIWEKVIRTIANKGSKQDRLKIEPTSRLDEALPVRCKNHNNLSLIKDANDFDAIDGGCAVEKCNGSLPCGHACQLMCHPFSHDIVNCRQPCGKTLTCGHQCAEACAEVCACKVCTKGRTPAQGQEPRSEPFDGKETLSGMSSSSSWKSFAEAESVRYAEAASAPPPFLRVNPKKPNSKIDLVDLGSEHQVTKDMRQLSFGVDGTTSRQQSPAPTAIVQERARSNGAEIKRIEIYDSIPTGSKPDTESVKDWSKEGSLLD